MNFHCYDDTVQCTLYSVALNTVVSYGVHRPYQTFASKIFEFSIFATGNTECQIFNVVGEQINIMIQIKV